MSGLLPSPPPTPPAISPPSRSAPAHPAPAPSRAAPSPAAPSPGARLLPKPEGADSGRRAERFVLRSHIIPLLDVLLSHRSALADATLSGRTHAGKYAARVLLVRSLIARDPSTRPCFGADAEIVRQNGTNEKIKDILRVLRARYDAVCAVAADADAAPNALRRAMESFAGLHYDEAKRKADALFRPAAVADTPETESGLASPAGATDASDAGAGASPGASGRVADASRAIKKRGGKSKGAMSNGAAAAAAAYLASADPAAVTGAARVEGEREAQMRAALVEERLKQARTMFGIEIFGNRALPTNVRATLLRKHGCDELADALADEEQAEPLC